MTQSALAIPQTPHVRDWPPWDQSTLASPAGSRDSLGYAASQIAGGMQIRCTLEGRPEDRFRCYDRDRDSCTGG